MDQDSETKWVHFTVPHSGTRFTNETFERSGYSVFQSHPPRGDMTWNHFNPKVLREQLRLLETDTIKICTVRDPIYTMGTHWAVLNEEPHPGRKGEAAGFRIERLQQSWGMQQAMLERYDFKIFRVDRDDIETFGKTIGANLTAPGRTNSRGTYAIKEAIDAKDVGMIKHLTKGTNYWNKFLNSQAQYKDVYEALGYDLWWL